MFWIGRVEECYFLGGLKCGVERAPTCNQPACICLFSSPCARPRNQSQSAEVALAWNCVVSVSHISGVAAADAEKT